MTKHGRRRLWAMLGCGLVAISGRAQTNDLLYEQSISSLRVWGGLEYSTLVGRDEGEDRKKLFASPSSYVSINQMLQLDREPDNGFLRKLQPEEFQAQLRFGKSGLETGKVAKAVSGGPSKETITEADMASIAFSALWYFRTEDKFATPASGEHRFLSYLRGDLGRSLDLDNADDQQSQYFGGFGLRAEGQYVACAEIGLAYDERFDQSPERTVIRGHWFYRSPKVEQEGNKENLLLTLGLLYSWSKAEHGGEDETTVGIVLVSDFNKLLGKFL